MCFTTPARSSAHSPQLGCTRDVRAVSAWDPSRRGRDPAELIGADLPPQRGRRKTPGRCLKARVGGGCAWGHRAALAAVPYRRRRASASISIDLARPDESRSITIYRLRLEPSSLCMASRAEGLGRRPARLPRRQRHLTAASERPPTMLPVIPPSSPSAFIGLGALDVEGLDAYWPHPEQVTVAGASASGDGRSSTPGNTVRLRPPGAGGLLDGCAGRDHVSYLGIEERELEALALRGRRTLSRGVLDSGEWSSLKHWAADCWRWSPSSL